MALLGVNIDHAATIREARKTVYPNIVQVALEAEAGGCDGITVHLREDRRHIQLADVILLKKHIHTRLNLEMALTENMLKIAEDIQPDFCCLVPEKREELTTEGGLNVIAQESYIQQSCVRLKKNNIIVSLFIDPNFAQIDAAARCGVPYIEIHTGHYAEEPTEMNLSKIKDSVKHAQKLGLRVNAGHGLNYDNTQAIADIENLVELNIGHAIIARALFVGIKEAVREMKILCQS